MQEILLEDLPRHKHEYWVLEGMLPLGGGVIKRKVAIRPKLECDAIIRMECFRRKTRCFRRKTRCFRRKSWPSNREMKSSGSFASN